jgi:hypothetical protein
VGQLLEITCHEFQPMDLYKLDLCFRDRLDIDCPDNSKGRSQSAKDYPSLHSLITPLFTYFQVLSAFAASSSDTEATQIIADSSARYYGHLHELHQRYKWSAIVEYHLQYLIHWHEMANGDYSGWGCLDGNLMNHFLYSQLRIHPDSSSKCDSSSPKSKSSKPLAEQFCFNFNKGECTSPCLDGRMHKCWKCSGDHTEKACKK